MFCSIWVLEQAFEEYPNVMVEYSQLIFDSLSHSAFQFHQHFLQTGSEDYILLIFSFLTKFFESIMIPTTFIPAIKQIISQIMNSSPNSYEIAEIALAFTGFIQKHSTSVIVSKDFIPFVHEFAQICFSSNHFLTQAAGYSLVLCIYKSFPDLSQQFLPLVWKSVQDNIFGNDFNPMS